MAMGSTPIPGCRARDPHSVLVFGLGGFLDHSPPAIETIGGDAVTQVSLTGLRIARQRRLCEPVMRAVHAASRRCLAAFLNGHGSAPESNSGNSSVSTGPRDSQTAGAFHHPPLHARPPRAGSRSRAPRAVARSAAAAAVPP